MLTQEIKVNGTIERAEKIVSTILKHLDNNKDCEHCKSLLSEVFE
jgi:hypothetical protein